MWATNFGDSIIEIKWSRKEKIFKNNFKNFKKFFQNLFFKFKNTCYKIYYLL